MQYGPSTYKLLLFGCGATTAAALQRPSRSPVIPGVHSRAEKHRACPFESRSKKTAKHHLIARIHFQTNTRKPAGSPSGPPAGLSFSSHLKRCVMRHHPFGSISSLRFDFDSGSRGSEVSAHSLFLFGSPLDPVDCPSALILLLPFGYCVRLFPWSKQRFSAACPSFFPVSLSFCDRRASTSYGRPAWFQAPDTPFFQAVS